MEYSGIEIQVPQITGIGHILSISGKFQLLDLPKCQIIIFLADGDISVGDNLLLRLSPDHSIEGVTRDHQPFNSTCFCTKIEGRSIEFITHRTVIGNPQDVVSHLMVQLINYPGPEWQLQLGIFACKVERDNLQIPNLVHNFSKWSDIKIPYHRLVIEAKEQSGSESDLFRIANHICKLLSLASGHTVTFNIQEYENGSNKWEVWKTQMSDFKRITQLIPDDSFCDYMKSTFEKWIAMPEESQKIMDTILCSLHGLNDGYLEDRIRTMVVFFELLADAEKPHSRQSEAISDLKKEIRVAYKDWIQRFPGSDQDGFLCDRMINSLDWTKVYDKICDLMDKYSITSKKPPDLKRWITLRNEVSHSGRFGEYPDNEYVADQLNQGTNILRQILLQQLGYSGSTMI